MRALAVQRDNPIPLYLQLAEEIKSRIASGEYKPGDRLASADLISEEAVVSRMTVRQALTHLQREGHLDIRQGAGTFVAAPKLTHHAVNLLGFTQEMLAQGKRPGSQVLEQRIVAPSATLQAQLQLAPNDLVIRIVRLRFSQGDPVLLETVHLPAERCPGLELVDLSHVSLYELLQERYGIRLAQSRQTFEATLADERHADVLGIAVGDPLMRLEGVTLGTGDAPVECFEAVFRGDRFQFEIESHRTAAVADQLLRPTVTSWLTESAH